MWAAFNGDIAKVRAALKEPEVAVDGTDEVRHGGLVVTGESSLSQYICFPQDGSTPLTAAAWGGHLDIVKLLLENGANIEAVNNTVRADSVSSYAACSETSRPPVQHGWNALMSAASRGHGDVVEYLLQKHANALVLDLHDCDAATYARQNKHTSVADALEAVMMKQRAAVRAQWGYDTIDSAAR